jgi:molybdenum cofactor cytidylyltransferase
MNFFQKKIAGVILAAGSGSRMGTTKQLLPFGDTTLLGRAIENAKGSALHEIIVVLGHQADKIKQIIDFSNTKISYNKAYSKGQSTSLIKGLEDVSSECDAAMFLLGDQPLVNAAIIDQLLYAFETSMAQIIIPHCKGQRGNPVIIARPLFHRLSSLSDDMGARALFKEFKDDILKVSIPDKAIIIDVDTMADYKKLISPKPHTME